MIPQSRRALSVGTVAACLALSACGGGSTAAARKPAAAPMIAATPAKLAGHFCPDAQAIMGAQPTNPTHHRATLTMVRAELERVLRSTAANFTALEREAPGMLRGPIKTIIGVYTSDQRQIASYGSIPEMGTSIVRANTTGQGGAAFRKVLAYMSQNCS